MSPQWAMFVLSVVGLIFAAGGAWWKLNDYGRRIERLEKWRDEQ